MDDIGIYDLGSKIILTVRDDIQKIMYEPINGNLNVVWGHDPTVNAWARSLSGLDKPPQHEIGINFELLRVVYRDIEAYFEYGKKVKKGLHLDIMENFFPKALQSIDVLPTDFDVTTSIKNAFIAAITWVFYHELAHLEQEHGYIRNQACDGSVTINEAVEAERAILTGRQAAVSHATELAADFSATMSCLIDLYLQFQGKNFLPSMRLFVIGVSCLIYRFNGGCSYIPTPEPEGSHPVPIIRLEGILPQMWEHVDLEFNTNLSREELVYSLSISAVSVGLFWLGYSKSKNTIPDNFFLEGHLNRPNCRSYFKEIIHVWGHLTPRIFNHRRAPKLFLTMTFSPAFIQAVYND